jgi:hypothetical protein
MSPPRTLRTPHRAMRAGRCETLKHTRRNGVRRCRSPSRGVRSVLTSCFKLRSGATAIVSTLGVVLPLAVCGRARRPTRRALPLRPKPHEVDWTQPVPPPAREQPPLGSEAEVNERYDLAWELVRADDYRSALEEIRLVMASGPTTRRRLGNRDPAPDHPEHRTGRCLPRADASSLHRDPGRPRRVCPIGPATVINREWSDWAELSPRDAAGMSRLASGLYEERRIAGRLASAPSAASKEMVFVAERGARFLRRGGTLFPSIYAMDELFDIPRRDPPLRRRWPASP